MEINLLDVAFIVAVTAFFKERFGLASKAALFAAFGVALFVGFAPLVAASFPVVQPWIEALFNVVKIFLAAAGSYDFVKSLRPA